MARRAALVQVSLRVRPEVLTRARELAARTEPYTPNLSQMLDRGLELAVLEQEKAIVITPTESKP